MKTQNPCKRNTHYFFFCFNLQTFSLFFQNNLFVNGNDFLATAYPLCRTWISKHVFDQPSHCSRKIHICSADNPASHTSIYVCFGHLPRITTKKPNETLTILKYVHKIDTTAPEADSMEQQTDDNVAQRAITFTIRLVILPSEKNIVNTHPTGLPFLVSSRMCCIMKERPISRGYLNIGSSADTNLVCKNKCNSRNSRTHKTELLS